MNGPDEPSTWMVTVNRIFRIPPLNILSSLKTTAALMIVFAVAIAKATFIESDYGADGARDLVYNATWFEAILVLFIVNLLLVFIRRLPYTARQTGSVVVHLAIVWILISAGITRYFGYEGVMPIREGTSTDFIWSSETHLQLQVGESEASFPVRLYRSGEQGIAQTVQVDGVDYRLALTEYWPHYALSYQPAESGPPALALTVATPDGSEATTLVAGEAGDVGGLALRLLQGPLPAVAGDDAPYGTLRVHTGGTSRSFPIPASVPAAFEHEGWRYEITEFQAAFKVGGDTDYASAMTNPMIRVAVTSPEGVVGERLLFAYHPDFSMGHGGGEDDFPGLDVVYDFARGLNFSRGDDGTVTARGSIAVDRIDMGTGEPEESYPAGTEFTVHESAIYRQSTGDFQFVLQESFAHVQLQPGPSQDENARSAARVAVTGADGVVRDRIVFEHDERGTAIDLGGVTGTLRLGSIRRELPYSLYLEDFVLLTYPGSRNPASYESHVKLYDPGQGIDGRPVRIYMNNPLTHHGRKHFQSSYDRDERGTVLSVNYDPGKWPTYIGYILLSLGFLLVLVRDLLWPLKSETFEGRRS